MTATCATCGFDCQAAFGQCFACNQRAALVESRREAMRAWLDRKAPMRECEKTGPWCPCRTPQWRDFEGASEQEKP